MPLTNKQKIIFFIIGLIILIIVLGLLGVIPGIKKQEDPRKKMAFTLNVWTVNENPKAFSNVIQNFKNKYPKASINLVNYDKVEDYKRDILNSLAAGEGPDIFMIKNFELKDNIKKIEPFPVEFYNLSKLRKDFPYIVEQEGVYQNLVYGLPLSVETLVLIYNRDLLDRIGYFESNLKTWDDLLKLIENIPQDLNNERIFKIPIGGSERSIKNAGDILLLLLLQKDAFLFDKDKGIFLKKEVFLEVLDFYKKFVDTLSNYYVWNNNLNALKEFENQRAIFLFDYYYNYLKLKEKKLNIGVLPMLQFDLLKETNLGDYWFFVVSKQSKFKNFAWEFLIDLTTNSNLVYDYLNISTNKLPILKEILNYQINNNLDQDLKIVLKQILTLRSVNFDYFDFKKELVNLYEKNLLGEINNDLFYSLIQDFFNRKFNKNFYFF